jgi:hypothetical protein
MEQVDLAGREPGKPDEHPLGSGQGLRDELDHPALIPGVAAGSDPFRVRGIALVDDRLLIGENDAPGRARAVG